MQCITYVLMFLYFSKHIFCMTKNPSHFIDHLKGETTSLLSEILSEENDSSVDDASESASKEHSNELSLENVDESELNLESKEENIMSKESLKQFISELLAGNTADLFGTNTDYKQPNKYLNLGRRFVPQYPYFDIPRKSKKSEQAENLIPQMASPELVLAVAKKSALLQASESQNPTEEVIRKEILRTGEYWNGVWKEDVNPNSLRSIHNKKNNLETVTIQVMPDSILYDMINRLKETAPRILYVINKNKT